MAFDPQPSLHGRLIQLRPLRLADFDPLHAAAADPLIWVQHPDRTRHEKASFRRFFRDALASGGALVVIDNADGRIVGCSRFHGYDEALSEVEIGWTFLARSHWGGTCNRELKRLMLDHAFRYVRSVVLLVAPENLRSRRAVEKIGGVLSGERPDGSGRASLVYRITDDGGPAR